MSESRLTPTAYVLIGIAIGGLAGAFLLSNGTQFLMPGPLTSAHGAIKNCTACHTASGSGKLSWVHGLMPRDPDQPAALPIPRSQVALGNALVFEALLRPTRPTDPAGGWQSSAVERHASILALSGKFRLRRSRGSVSEHPGGVARS